MKKEAVFVLAMVVVVLSCAGYSSATVLGTIESSRTSNGLGKFSNMGFSIGYPIEIWNSDRTICQLDFSISLSWQDISEDDIGKTFIGSADTHRSFDALAFLLTNGVDNQLHLADEHTMALWPNATHTESVLINGIHDGVDFEGYIIDNIALTVNELFLDYDADAIKGGLTNYSYDITYTINGEMIANPEPATVMLFGLGGLALLRKRRI
jgi:hypothetical protein